MQQLQELSIFQRVSEFLVHPTFWAEGCLTAWLTVEIIFAIIMDFGNLNIITNIQTNTLKHTHTQLSICTYVYMKKFSFCFIAAFISMANNFLK